MVYPVTFYRLAISGSLYSEQWATTLSLFGGNNDPVDTGLLESIAAVNETFINGNLTNGLSFINSVSLKETKLNRIAPDGRYADPESFTYFHPAGIVGNSGSHSAPQLAAVATLRTAFERGRASRGRMYLPPMSGFNVPSTDGRASAATALAVANGVGSWFNALHSAFTAWVGGSGGGAHPVVMSDVGQGTWHSVTSIDVGRVIDTMRSRRSSLAEDYQTSTVVPNWPLG